MDLLSSLSLRGQPNWVQATVSTILQNLIQTIGILNKLLKGFFLRLWVYYYNKVFNALVLRFA